MVTICAGYVVQIPKIPDPPPATKSLALASLALPLTMSSNNQGLIRNIIYGATILGFGAIMYYLFFKPSKLTIKGPAGPAAPKTGKTAASAAAAQSTAPVKSAAKHVVEDVESDEEDEEEDEDTVSEPTAVQAAVEADLREQYDAAVRMAQKLIKCEDHHKALAKLTEALSLAAALPSIPSKELIALYNNRSAMMEKTGKPPSVLLFLSVFSGIVCVCCARLEA